MFYRPRLRKTAPWNMAPMIDMVFLLLIFFMVATVFPENDGIVIEKPKADNAAPLRSDQLMVTVTAEGAYRHDGMELTLDDLAFTIDSAFAANPAVTLIVKADRRSETGHVVSLMDLAREHGVTRMALATEKRAEKAPPP